MDIIEEQRSTATSFGNLPLLISPNGQIITLDDGYIPLLANFTFEDKAAKGLRKRKSDDKPETPVYFSALELVRDNRILLLSGPSGSGKTSFARYLVHGLATKGSIKYHPLVRNEDGIVHDEGWEGMSLVPFYLAIAGPESLVQLINTTLPRLVEPFEAGGQEERSTFLIVLDTIERSGDQGPIILADLLALIKPFENIKLLVLGETSGVKHWFLPPDVVRHDLLPLLKIQRQQAMNELIGTASPHGAVGVGPAAATPAYFALSLEAKNCGTTPENILDEWLAVITPKNEDFNNLPARAIAILTEKSIRDDSVSLPILFSSRAVQQLLAARYLSNLPIENATALFHRNPLAYEPIIRSLLARLKTTSKLFDLIEKLIKGSGINSQLGALLVSDFVVESSQTQQQISDHMLSIVNEDVLPILQREKAGRVLSRLRDPRDLTALVNIPAGNFVFGSLNHPNSHPVHEVSLESFRIGVYPVTNRDFSSFIRESGREWNSPSGFAPEWQNAPATDLTWYDAVAYCVWLTKRWRSCGKIDTNQRVRLPTEPEWERAARGDQVPDTSSQELNGTKPVYIYPWGSKWLDDAANYEESGLNSRCSVGLFPKGRSPYGCYDMAGQIWEWCSTLWGSDMTTPSERYKYPWCNDDGREDLDAPGEIRRVLRGGCFSSGRQKICCTYRGSLEPGGSWRGNGFRIVVASSVP